MKTAYSTTPRPDCLPENPPPDLPDTAEEALALMREMARAESKAARLDRHPHRPQMARQAPRPRIAVGAKDRAYDALQMPMTGAEMGAILGICKDSASEYLRALLAEGRATREMVVRHTASGHQTRVWLYQRAGQ